MGLWKKEGEIPADSYTFFVAPKSVPGGIRNTIQLIVISPPPPPPPPPSLPQD